MSYVAGVEPRKEGVFRKESAQKPTTRYAENKDAIERNSSLHLDVPSVRRADGVNGIENHTGYGGSLAVLRCISDFP